MVFKKNQQGMGIVAVLVAGAIAAIIALALSKLMTDASRSQKSAQQTTDASQLMSQINYLLSNTQTCARNFGTSSSEGAISLGSTLLTRDLVDSSGGLTFDVNSNVTYENNSIYIKNYKYEQVSVVSTSPYSVVGRLTFNLEKTNIANSVSVGGKNLTRSLILATTLTGPGGSVLSCGSVGEQTNSLTLSCPSGHYVTGFNMGVPICTALTLSCGSGEVLAGVSAGSPVCVSAPTITSSSFGDNGYIQYSNGFTIQWGRHYFATDTTYTINYSTSFTQVYSVVISGTECSGGNCQDNAASVVSINTTSFTASTARDGAHYGYWIAYGHK